MPIRNVFLLILCWCMLNQADFNAQDLNQSLDALIQSKPLKHASVSFNLIDLKDGKSIQSINPQMALIPASSMKVLTTSAALGLLGKEHTFKTELYYCGNLDEDGTLTGDIILKGYGDPTLGSDRIKGNLDLNGIFALFAQKISEAGIHCISGDIIIDNAAYGTAKVSPSWLWEDLGNYYASGAWSLNINENLYYINFQQKNKEGSLIEIKSLSPEIPFLSLKSEILAGPKGSRDNAYIFGGPHQYERYIRGSIPPGNGIFKIKGSMPDPEYFAAHQLKKAISKMGIAHSGYLTKSTWLEDEIDKTSMQLIFQHQSPSVAEIVALANSKSINLYCDALLLEMGKRVGSPTLENGIKAIVDFWVSKGLDKDAIFLQDGSGLSPRNSISSEALSRLFYLVSQDKALYPSFFKSLSVAGESGTLRGMLKNSSARGNVYAKSGYIDRVLTYTGYVHASSGNKYAFSIMINNFTGKTWPVRQKLEKLFESLYKL